MSVLISFKYFNVPFSLLNCVFSKHCGTVDIIKIFHFGPMCVVIVQSASVQ